MSGMDHNRWGLASETTLDVDMLATQLRAHPDMLDFDPDAQPDKVVDISRYEDKTLKNAVVRSRLKRLAMMGKNAVEAAAVIGWSPQAVRNIFRDASFRQDVLGTLEGVFDTLDTSLAEEQKTEAERLESFRTSAFEKMVSEFDSYNANQRIKITLDMLDRSDTLNRRSTSIHKDAALTSETLANAHRAALEMDDIRERKLTSVRRVG